MQFLKWEVQNSNENAQSDRFKPLWANTMQKQKLALTVPEMPLTHVTLLTVPSQRETQPRLGEEGHHVLKSSLQTQLSRIHVLI